MPRDLPGFYWDPQRNRYFPIGTRPPGPLSSQSLRQPQVPPTPPSDGNYSYESAWGSATTRVRKRRNLWRLTDLGKSELINHSQQALLRHDLFGLHVSRTTCAREERLPIFGEIRNFISTTSPTGQQYRLVGDSQGWIYSSHLDAFTLPGNNNTWTVETNLDPDSETSSLNICDTYSLATSFGPVSKMRVQKLDDPNLSFVITAKNTHDIRCASYTLNPSEIVVGAKQHAVYLTDIFNQPKTRILKTHSDVFSVVRDHDLIYAGTRNGSIHRFDLRIPSTTITPTTKTTIFTDITGSNHSPKQGRKSGSTVLHMQLVDDVYFLTSYMNGELVLYDIRYAQRSTPVLRFRGHVNSHTARLGITTDPTSTLLFAAGQDCKIRGWSMRTGEPLLPPLSNNNDRRTTLLFGAVGREGGNWGWNGIVGGMWGWVVEI
ncbi:hypothetical protein D9756_004994 [Leucocoprinus leucothites]|uniref:WD40 repeat-like protein n=1 Tax=Leucocoprinus leucothites TaxID=201217 RepID=A0A8H5GA41_9AGAR|nr:hypothetical protein D9756_004994 [Leucoagaricus leucothites]